MACKACHPRTAPHGALQRGRGGESALLAPSGGAQRESAA
ncbi:Hypothetical Protein RSKD131_2203 [Cereibacter sphaeroides KD131]|nr:Hypothetical Protein RSKD131_2203 [Cereibacter sphaeroides KD131]